MLSTTHNANVANQLTAVDTVATLVANDRAQGGRVSLRTHRFLGKRPSLTGRAGATGSLPASAKRPSILRPCQPTLCSAVKQRNRRESERWLKRSEAGYLPAPAWATLVIHRGHMPSGGKRPVARERRIEAAAC
jgi:hypothetical protein